MIDKDILEGLSDTINVLQDRVKYLNAHPDEIDDSEGMTKPYADSHFLMWLESELDRHLWVRDYLMKHGPMR